MTRFLLYYRIIEYAVSGFIDQNVRADLKKVLSAPDLRSSIPNSVEKVVNSFAQAKLDDVQKLGLLLRTSVYPSVLWNELEASQEFFSHPTKFDGGFCARAIISKDTTESSFGAAGVETVANAFRRIRNALSHGKDQETAGLITPTTRNVNLLQPWVHLLAVAAGEVVLYKDTA